MKTSDYILNKFGLSFDDKTPMPIEIPDFGRNQLADLLHELDFKIGAEVGVAAGDYSEVICRANPQMKVYGIDPYAPLEGYKDYARRSTFEKFHTEAKARLAPCNNYVFIYKTSMDAIKDFADNSLDFVYIDANHEEPFITQDITEWYKKVRSGGILAGHDYSRPRSKDDMSPHHDVKGAVQSYTTKNDIKLWFVLGRWPLNEGLIRDNPRSWMWVKT